MKKHANILCSSKEDREKYAVIRYERTRYAMEYFAFMLSG